MIDPIKPDQTFQDHEISTGDIVVYQVNFYFIPLLIFYNSFPLKLGFTN